MKHLAPLATLLSALLIAGCNGGLTVFGQPAPTPTNTPPPFNAPGPAATRSPTPPPTLAPAEPPIVVDTPQDGDTVFSPIRITGSASVFEGNVQARVVDANGRIVGQAFGTATAGAPGRGTFVINLPYTGGTGPGTVEVYSGSPRDGSTQNLVSRKVTLR